MGRALEISEPGRRSESRVATVCQLLIGLGIGGAEVLAARMARRLRSNYRFIFACLDEQGPLGEELRSEGFPIHVLGRRPGVDWRCARRLARLLRRERVDLVHAHQYTPFFYGVTARLPWRRPPVLFTEHGRWFPDHPRPKRIIVNRLLLRQSDRVVGVGQSVRQALIHNEGIPARRVDVIYNGINFAAFSGDFSDPGATRREIGIGDGELMIIQVARLDPLKDHATAIATLEHVVRRRPEARLVLVGEGPERAQVEALVRERGLTPWVRFLGLRTDIPRLLRAADLFLLTSVSEGIPLTIIEAMAAGLPVVATRVGGVGEIVHEGRTGLLAPSGDHEALALHSLRLAESSELRAEMGRLGRQRAVEDFSESQMIDQYHRLYREIFQSR